jgi:hypothetical protein
MTAATATMFRIDPLHPSRLLCECCGESVCEVSADSEVMEYASGLTAQQAALDRVAGASRAHPPARRRVPVAPGPAAG